MSLGVAAAACDTTAACPPGHLCIRGGCTRVIAPARPSFGGEAGNKTGRVAASCFNNTYTKDSAPTGGSCVTWFVDAATNERVCQSNAVPPYYVPPYCPFGAGEGYCQSPTQGNSTDCPPFAGQVCPCKPNSVLADDDEAGGTGGCPSGTTAVGDVMVPIYQEFRFPMEPDPTRPDRPLHSERPGAPLAPSAADTDPPPTTPPPRQCTTTRR